MLPPTPAASVIYMGEEGIPGRVAYTSGVCVCACMRAGIQDQFVAQAATAPLTQIGLVVLVNSHKLQATLYNYKLPTYWLWRICISMHM